MRRYFESLRPADLSAIDSAADGLFLVRVLPRFARESTTTRWLALPAVWFCDEPDGPPSTISQPVRRRSRAEPHHTM